METSSNNAEEKMSQEVNNVVGAVLPITLTQNKNQDGSSYIEGCSIDSMKMLEYDKITENEEILEKVEVNVGSHFDMHMLFDSKEELIEWARAVGKSLGYVVTIKSSDKLDERSKPRVFLSCDRSGKYRDNQNKKGWVNKGMRRSSSKRCGCPFSIKGQRELIDGKWKIYIICGTHNHERVHMEAHAYAGRLAQEEGKLVEQMYSSGVKPRKILSAVKKGSSNNTTVIRTIYNERVKLLKKELDGGTTIQYLYKRITDAGYVSFNQVSTTDTQLERLFFAHPVSIKLSNMFPTVFQLDCTYKTNRYRMPLLCIVGVTSTNLTFFSCFTFMSNETESSYKWALDCFKSILDSNTEPNVFVTDREQALMNAIKVVFPSTKNILCQVHINRNILANCKKYFTEGKIFEIFMGAWQKVVDAQTENEFNRSLNSLVVDYSSNYCEVVTYVMTTWINPYKTYFVSAWINKYLHLGNSTTNRVESSHSQLKKFLEVSIGNLATIWRTFDQMINIQHTDIKRSFGSSCIQVSKEFSSYLYSDLLGRISLKALQCIKEVVDVMKNGLEYCTEDNCTHEKRCTMGLPCGHEFVPYVAQSKPIPIWFVHGHWKQLSLTMDMAKVHFDESMDISNELEAITQKFNFSNDVQKKELKRKLREIINPSTTQTTEPLIKLHLKGRPKGSKKKFTDNSKSTKRDPSHFEYVLMEENAIKNSKLKAPPKLNARKRSTLCGNKNQLHNVRDQLPFYLSHDILEVVDVLGDGHCGYRVISQALKIGGGWSQVRFDLHEEIGNHILIYDNMFGKTRREELLCSLECNTSPATLDKWMSMPDMGPIIASCYNIVLVQLSKVQSFTFLPLHSSPPAEPNIIFIGFINDNHFVGLRMRVGCPFPLIFPQWRRYCEEIAQTWETIFASNIVMTENNSVPSQPSIHLDDSFSKV